jgi:hypothetical protein
MKKNSRLTRASTHLPFSARFLPLAMEFVDKGVRAFGYGEREAVGLVLATEELFAFYLGQATASTAIDIELEDQGCRLVLTLAFRIADPDLRAFNLTWHVDPDSDASLATLGPMIAARSVSRLRIDFGDERDHERVILRLERDRDYARAGRVALPDGLPPGRQRVAEATPDDLRHFAAMVSSAAAASSASSASLEFLPPFLEHPAMAADMAAAGELVALLLHRGEWIVGGVLWRPLTGNCLELFGPYGFSDDDGQGAAQLLEAAVARISRSGYRGVVRRQGPLANHERFFDFLGQTVLYPASGQPRRLSYYYRALDERGGGAVYCRASLATFLAREYARLCLPRQLREGGDDAAQRRAASVLTVEIEPAQSLATLRPLCAGPDMAANLRAHLDLLRAQGLLNFQVEIDTGRADDTAYATALEETGFIPRLLLPDAGRGDLVIYDHRSDAE